MRGLAHDRVGVGAVAERLGDESGPQALGAELGHHGRRIAGSFGEAAYRGVHCGARHRGVGEVAVAADGAEHRPPGPDICLRRVPADVRGELAGVGPGQQRDHRGAAAGVVGRDELRPAGECARWVARRVSRARQRADAESVCTANAKNFIKTAIQTGEIPRVHVTVLRRAATGPMKVIYERSYLQ